MWTVNATSSIAKLMDVQIDARLSDTEYAGANGVQNFLDYIASSNTVRLATRAKRSTGEAEKLLPPGGFCSPP